MLEHALVRDGTAELHVAALQALLETAEADYESFAKRYVTRISWLKSFLGHTDDEGRDQNASSSRTTQAYSSISFSQ